MAKLDRESSSKLSEAKRAHARYLDGLTEVSQEASASHSNTPSTSKTNDPQS